MKYILLSLLPFLCFADKIQYRDGRELVGTVKEANSTHFIFEKKSDKQLFNIPLDNLTDNSKKYIQEYISSERYIIGKLQLPLSDKQINMFSDKVDYLIDENLKKQRLSRNKEVDKYTFARRAYLTIIGRIPTEKELLDFVNDRFASKLDLIKKLLDHPGHVSHQLNWLSDLLRVKDRINGVNIDIGAPYRNFLKQSLQENKKYDQLVRDLVASSGNLFEEDGSPISYYLRDRGMQEDNLSHTLRIFTGTRLQCAMCHDHPFDRWTQKEFYEMTAFTSGVGRVAINDQSKKIGALTRLINKDGDENSGKFLNWRNEVRDSIQFGIENNGSGKIKLPRDYAEDDGNPGDLVYAKSILSPRISIESSNKNPQSRQELAEWITSDVNPRFTRVIANRMWKRAFGVGLIEPVDNIMDNTFASNEPLMIFLEKVMFAVDYDLKEFNKILFNTKLFSRESVKEDFKSLETFSFQGPVLRRMTGEQIWDSLVTLVYNNIDHKERDIPQKKDNYKKIYEKYKNSSAEEIYEDFKKVITENPNIRRFSDAFNDTNQTAKKIKDKQLVRSSLLAYPAPGGHLIRQFGGSDKEQIENASLEPNTTQVLNLLNGFVEKNILRNKNADFIKSIESQSNAQKQVESAFLSIFGRKPNPKESEKLKQFIDGPNGFKHVSWILLNSHEFIFIK